MTPAPTPGRCVECGWHFATQGHRPGCDGEVTPEDDLPADFVGRLQKRKLLLKPPPPSTTAHTTVVDDAYAAAAHRDEIQQLSRCPNGQRNHALNIAALKLGRLPIDRDTLRTDLISACEANGLVHDDGLKSVDATINSGFKKADQDGPRQMPERHDNIEEVTAEQITSVVDLRERKIELELEQLRIRDEARRLFAKEKSTAAALPDGIGLTELLAQPDDDIAYRIDELLPTGGRALLAAQFKAGKTTLVANLARSLVDGTPFLGRFTTTTARVAIVDDEMDTRQLRRQLRDQGIRNTTAITIFSLRGRVSAFDLLDHDRRQQWIEKLRGHDVIVIDCLRPILDALGLDESHDAGRFLIALDELLREAGISEAILVHHMGHVGERSRGDSRLLDWPDVIWKIVRDKTEDDAPEADRYFSAYGRDVDVREGKLDYTPETRSLMYVDANRKEAAGRAALPDLIDALVAAGDGLSGRALEHALMTRGGHSQKAVRSALKLAREEKVTYIKAGPRNAMIHYLNPSSASVRHSALPVRQRGQSECVSASIETHTHSLPTEDTPVRHDALEDES